MSGSLQSYVLPEAGYDGPPPIQRQEGQLPGSPRRTVGTPTTCKVRDVSWKPRQVFGHAKSGGCRCLVATTPPPRDGRSVGSHPRYLGTRRAVAAVAWSQLRHRLPVQRRNTVARPTLHHGSRFANTALGDSGDKALAPCESLVHHRSGTRATRPSPLASPTLRTATPARLGGSLISNRNIPGVRQPTPQTPAGSE